MDTQGANRFDHHRTNIHVIAAIEIAGVGGLVVRVLMITAGPVLRGLGPEQSVVLQMGSEGPGRAAGSIQTTILRPGGGCLTMRLRTFRIARRE